HGFQWADDIPDPQAEKTFESAVLSWSWPEGTFHYQLRELYRDVLHARRLWAPLRDRRHTRARVVDTEGASLLIVERGREEKMTAVANLSDKPQKPLAPNAGALLFSTEEQRYGGKRQLQESIEMLAP